MRLALRLDQLARSENSMVRVEALVLVQVHCPQGGSYGSLSWSEDRASEQHLGVLPDAF